MIYGNTSTNYHTKNSFLDTISHSFVHVCLCISKGTEIIVVINEYNPLLSGFILVRLTELVGGKPFKLCDHCYVPEIDAEVPIVL